MIATCSNCARALLPEDEDLGYCYDKEGCDQSRQAKIDYLRARERQWREYLS